MLQCNKCNFVARLLLYMVMPVAAFQLAALPAIAEAPEDVGSVRWPGADAVTGRIADYAALKGLAADFPDSASVRLRLINAQIGADDFAAAASTIAQLYERGYRLSPASEQQVIELAGADAHERLAQLFGHDSQPVGESIVFTTIPSAALLVESLAYDPKHGMLYATTVISHALYAADGDGAWHPVPLGDAAALTGIVRDPATGLIWVASGDPGLGSEPVAGFRGLIGYDPVAGEVVRRVAAPSGSNPSDLTIGPDGTLYVSDPLSGVIYRAFPDAKALDPLVDPGTFHSPQGLAVGQGGQVLYVSDYRYGLATIDLANGAVHRLGSTGSLFLDGIDGLWLDGDALIAVQNGSRPMRILRLALSPGGQSIAAENVLEQANPAWSEPLGGTITGGLLLYIGNGQWDRFGEGGAPDPDNPPGPTQIRALHLSRGEP